MQFWRSAEDYSPRVVPLVQTSSPAPAMIPPFNASARSLSTTDGPLAVFMSHAVLFIFFKIFGVYNACCFIV